MTIGTYFIDAGTIITMFFKSPQFQQIGQFLISAGIALNAGQGSVGPIRVGNDELTISISPTA